MDDFTLTDAECKLNVSNKNPEPFFSSPRVFTCVSSVWREERESNFLCTLREDVVTLYREHLFTT